MPLLSVLGLLGVLGLMGCHGAPDAHASAHAPGPSASASAEPPPHGSSAHPAAHPAPGARFVVPFIPAGSEATLQPARRFLASALEENERFVKRNGVAHFAPFVDTQKPRATLITCADSRVQTPAFDASPENDVFTIRNIGNQLSTSEGSVDYGVEHLHTPLLLVLGHTGCGAVKAAMGDFSQEAAPIRRELETLHVPKAKPGEDATALWADAVAANVHDQVGAALAKFSHEVEEGKLVVVGAVYDLRNETKRGHGRLVIVNVNGATEPNKLAAFVKALDTTHP